MLSLSHPYRKNMVDYSVNLQSMSKLCGFEREMVKGKYRLPYIINFCLFPDMTAPQECSQCPPVVMESTFSLSMLGLTLGNVHGLT